MKDYLKQVKQLCFLLLIAMFLLFSGRLFFFVINYQHFSFLDFKDLFESFLVGMRFDLSTFIYMNLPILVLLIFPVGKLKERKFYWLFIKYYFIIINSCLLLINLSDARYYDFIQKRSTAYILKFLAGSEDLPILIPRYFIDYWYVPFTWLLLTFLTWFFYPDMKHISNKKKKETRNFYQKFFSQSLLTLFLITLLIIGARGGLQEKPLSVTDAAKYSSAKLAPLVLNTPFAIMVTYGHENLVPKTYFSPEKCHEIYPVLHQYNYPDSSFKKMNVVVIILESFSREYSGYLNNYIGFTPFLDSLMQHSLLFTNAFSNGSSSMEGIPSVVSSIPSLMSDPYLISVYNNDKIKGLAEILKEKGYQTAFFHGGNNGTMKFDSFAELAGFDKYYGRTEYNNDKDYDGYWGIYDDAFLQYLAKTLNQFSQPFFAVEFTLSSHSPYKLPEKYQDKFPETRVDMHRAVQYTDESLRQFFKTASSMPWFNNTMFVLVADHPGHSVTKKETKLIKEGYRLTPEQIRYYKNTVGRFAIPLLFYLPGSDIERVEDFTVQQSDIMPSILDYLHYNGPFVSFGMSVFNDTATHVAFQYLNEYTQIIRGDYNLLFDGDKAVCLYNFRKDTYQFYNLMFYEKQTASEMELKIKSIMQQYSNRITNNRMYPDDQNVSGSDSLVTAHHLD